MAELTLKGDEALIQQLERLEDLPRLLQPAVVDIMDLLLKRMQEYPPGRGGGYQRTGKLRSSWQAIPISSGDVLGRVVSNDGTAPYNRYVQAAASQAWMHQGRWQTDRQVAKEKEAEAARILTEALNRILASQ